MNIYTIKKEYDDILNNPNYVDYETWEINEEWEKALQENQDNLESKAENIARFLKNLDWENDVYKKEIERINTLKKQNENKIKSLKRLLDYALDGQAIKTELFKFSYRNSEKSEILDKDKLPKKFITTETVEKIASLNDIKKYLKEEIQVRIEDLKQDNKEYYENDIKSEVYAENGLNITFCRNLQIK